MQTFQGLAVSDGLTVGPVVRIDRGAAGLHRIVCDPFRERALYEAAIVLAKDELNRLQQHALQLTTPVVQARAYFTRENTGQSYNLRSAAENLERSFKPDNAWNADYTAAWNAAG